MVPSEFVSSALEHDEILNTSCHTFTSDLSGGDWDFSDHSDDSTEEIHLVQSTYKSVTFGKVRIRSYPMILGDNPSCSRGLPVTLDWKSIGQSEEFELDVIESDDLPKRPVSRLSSKCRRELFLRMGISERDASKITEEIDEIKRSRSLSILDHTGVNVAMTKTHPQQNETRLWSKQNGKQFSIKQFNMDEYLRMVSQRRKKAS